MAKLSDYYRSLKWSEPCLACGRPPTRLTPNEVDHVQPPSLKLNRVGLAPRTHKKPGAWWCFPLCPDCHHARHRTREDTFYSFLGDRRALEQKVIEYWQRHLGSIPEGWESWYEKQDRLSERPSSADLPGAEPGS